MNTLLFVQLLNDATKNSAASTSSFHISFVLGILSIRYYLHTYTRKINVEILRLCLTAF
jgi:hypothetical protein